METKFISHPPHIKREMTVPKVMAFGYFDGVHIGHQRVIQTAKEIAEKQNMTSSVMTFSPHPSIVLRRENAIQHAITPLHDKIEAIEKLGIHELYIVDFNEQFSQLLPQQFIDQYVIGLNCKHVVAGFDFTYGKMGKGTMETLPFHSREQFSSTIVPKVEQANGKISSSFIRDLLRTGDVNRVQLLQGRPYKIKGLVVDGEKRGSSIGFPTANIHVEEPYLIPRVGVYAVQMKVKDKWYNGVSNIGFKPTFHQHMSKVTIEVHLFDFNENIYGSNIELLFIERIRDEQKFNGVEELISRIKVDVNEAKNLLNTVKR
ncbi:bifunctional riboflavin kinase/FAD synthetase [Bacillus sp. DJP31]|uniref:bifunctional riboflavin kinase/FAD synthetase n=1 Tax=Bacillus sp. DJP31 TaxID=3409789 RepID=UPI003BB7DAC5